MKTTEQSNTPIWVRIWDAFALLLVAFPLLTGGVWIRRPHLKIELTELAVPVLIVAFFGLVLTFFFSRSSRRSGSWTQKSWVLSKLKTALGFWSQALEHDRVRALFWGALPVFGLYALAACRRHWAFHSGAFDLGIFGNAIANLTLGNGYVSSVKDGVTLFADHQSPAFFLYAPIYWLFPRAETLLVLQAAVLASTGVAAGLLAHQALSSSADPKSKARLISAITPLLVWMLPPIRVANLFDFHPETMMLPAFLWAIYGIQSSGRRARVWGWVAFVIGLLSKESGGPIAVGIGLVWLVSHYLKSSSPLQRRPRSGAAAILLGLTWFLFATHVVPELLHKPYVYEELFSQYGNGLTGILTAPFLRPTVFWPQFFSWPRIQFYLFIFAPLAFLPLAAPWVALSALPGILMIILSAGNLRVAPIYHYGIEPSIGLIWALPLGWTWLENKLKERQRPLLHYAILFFALVSYNKSELFEIRFHAGDDHTHWLRKEFLPQVSARSLSASGNLVPHLIQRPWIHYLPHYLNAQQRPVDCVIYDPNVINWTFDDADRARLDSEMSRLGFREILKCGEVRAFQNERAESACFSVPPETIPCHPPEEK